MMIRVNAGVEKDQSELIRLSWLGQDMGGVCVCVCGWVGDIGLSVLL